MQFTDSLLEAVVFLKYGRFPVFFINKGFLHIGQELLKPQAGDGTYDVSQAPQLVYKLLSGPYDMVTAVRDLEHSPTYKRMHLYGTRLLAFVVNSIFKGPSSDMFSGYRIFSRRFVKSFPMISSGFEIETELTMHALELQMKTTELLSSYIDREPGSESKLKAFRDGFKVLCTIFLFVKEERPLQLFIWVFIILSVTAFGLAAPLLPTYLATRLVPRLPTALLSSGLMLLGFLSLVAGFVLSYITTARRELKRLFYLSIPAPNHPDLIGQFTDKQ